MRVESAVFKSWVCSIRLLGTKSRITTLKRAPSHGEIVSQSGSELWEVGSQRTPYSEESCLHDEGDQREDGILHQLDGPQHVLCTRDEYGADRTNELEIHGEMAMTGDKVQVARHAWGTYA